VAKAVISELHVVSDTRDKEVHEDLELLHERLEVWCGLPIEIVTDPATSVTKSSSETAFGSDTGHISSPA
jgi:hypothetical protein